MGGGGGKKPKKPTIQALEMPEAPAPAPPPEATAQSVALGSDDGAMRRKQREAKSRGTGALRIDLNIAGNGGAAGSSGLNIPKT